MSKQEDTKKELPEPTRSWQFGLKHLLLLPVAMGLLLGFFIAMYPFSRITLPVLVFSLAAAALYQWLKAFRPSRSRFSLTHVVATGVLFYILATLFAPGCVTLSNTVTRMICANNLKRIMLALHAYHDKYGCFPPAYVADANGRPMHSWRVLILPFMDEQSLYAQYRMDEPWDGPNNRQLHGIQVPYVYQCPEQSASGQSMTSYLAVVGPETAWPGAISIKFGDIRDGIANTLMVVEVADSGIHWMEPRDLDAAAMPLAINPPQSRGISSLHGEASWWRRLLGATVAFADGSVRFLPTDTPGDKLRAMLTIAGGEVVKEDGESR